jgi:hypothetical protein
MATGELTTQQKARKKWRENNKVKKNAARTVQRAVKNSCIAKPQHCEACAKQNDNLHGHHDDYSQPLNVRWLCSPCHRAWHKIYGKAPLTKGN